MYQYFFHAKRMSVLANVSYQKDILPKVGLMFFCNFKVLKTEKTHGSTHYRPIPAKRESGSFKKKSSNKEQDTKNHKTERHHKGIHMGKKSLQSCVGTVPAKRPTDLPVVPHVITDECKWV